MKYSVDELTKTDEIVSAYHVNTLLAKVIESKEMGLEQYRKMIDPKPIYHDFSCFAEGEMALDRIREALDQDEKICIYGDYDCDGILATAIMANAFAKVGKKVGYHIPNRFKDGYGLNTQRVEQMAQKGYSLIITVDNGIKAFDAVQRANELGTDVIITDHHAFEENEYPDAYCIVHPQMEPYPFKDICGGFIAYKLATALLGHDDPYLYCLAAITTISDMMPLIDENRTLVKQALTLMKKNHYPQLDGLLGRQEYSTSSIGFTIAPKINSFGRLPEIVNPNNLVHYFLQNCDKRFMYAVTVNAKEINSKRQSLTQTQYHQALKDEHQQCLYYSSKDVHEGIVGLIAGKYAREFEQPALVMHYDEEKKMYKGSARGVTGFNIYKFFTRHKDLVTQFGGHAMAGGFSVDADHYELLHQALLDDIHGRHFENAEYVIPVTFNDLSLENVSSLDLLAPYGHGNEEPLFILRDVVFDNVRQLSDGKHLRFDRQLDHCRFSALYFFKGELYEQVKDQPVTLIGTLTINEFRGYQSVNMMVKDLMTDPHDKIV